MANWQTFLDRWRSAGLIDTVTADHIHAWELEHGQAGRPERLARLAFGLGGLLLAAGVLLFVAAHWDSISPSMRFGLVLLMVAVFHVSAVAVSPRSGGLSMTLHSVGTAALGAGIFLSGQIFNMAEHWPTALLLWGIGAAAALVLLRDWPHVLWVAVLAPAWLWAEWMDLHGPNVPRSDDPVFAGCLLLAIVYLNARAAHHQDTWRDALARLGALAIIPLGFALGATSTSPFTVYQDKPEWDWIVWTVPLVVPAAVAIYLRRQDAIFLAFASILVLLISLFGHGDGMSELVIYALYAVLCAGLVFWGVRDRQKLTVNIGIAGFALTVLFFYFASLFDKLGRSLGLIGLGVVFIGGGWLLERTRRRLIVDMNRSAA